MRADDQKLILLDGEEVVETIHPHVLAFYRTYGIWIVFGVVSVLLVACGAWLAEYLTPVYISAPAEVVDNVFETFRLAGFAWGEEAEQMANAAYVVVLWWYFIVLFGSLVSFLKINFIWLLLFGVIGAISTLLGSLADVLGAVPLFGALAGLFGLWFTSIYRKRHSFIITNYRLVMQVDFLSFRERQLFFSHLSDMAIEQSIVGRLFDFGTLIPISQSGLGLGEDMAVIGGSYSNQNASIGLGAGRMIAVPRGQTAYVLFGVPQPKRIHYLLEQLIHFNEGVMHLREIEKKLGKMKFMDLEEKELGDS